jgi:predicted aspartyl protease
VRLETQGGDDTLLVSAYRSEDDQRWVVVAVNLANKSVVLKLEALQGQLPDSVQQVETSEQFDLALVDTGAESGIWTLAPLSVTTLVMDR